MKMRIVVECDIPAGADALVKLGQKAKRIEKQFPDAKVTIEEGGQQ